MTPQLTEQYGQVPRVSVVRASLKARTSASASCGEKPSPTAEDVPSPSRKFERIGVDSVVHSLNLPVVLMLSHYFLVMGVRAKNSDNLQRTPLFMRHKHMGGARTICPQRRAFNLIRYCNAITKRSFV